MEHHVWPLGCKDLSGVVRDDHAGVVPAISNHGGHVSAYLLRINVDGPDERHRVGFGKNGLGGGLANGAETILNNTQRRVGIHESVAYWV